MDKFEKFKTNELQKLLKKIKKNFQTRQEMIEGILKYLNLFSLVDLKEIAKKLEINYSGNKEQIVKRIENIIPLSLKTKYYVEKKISSISEKQIKILSLSFIVLLLGFYNQDTIIHLSKSSLKSLLKNKISLNDIKNLDFKNISPMKIEIAKKILKNKKEQDKIKELIFNFEKLKI